MKDLANFIPPLPEGPVQRRLLHLGVALQPCNLAAILVFQALRSFGGYPKGAPDYDAEAVALLRAVLARLAPGLGSETLGNPVPSAAERAAQADHLAQELADFAASRTVEVEAGAGLVKVEMTLGGRLQAVAIDTEMCPDPELLAGLVIAAVNEASERASQELRIQLDAGAGGP